MRNLNKVCNKEIEEPTGQETIREREKKYKKERMCALSSIWDQPINREKKNMLSKGKEIRTYGNRHLDWTPFRTLLFLIILLRIEFYPLFSYLDLD